MFYLKKINSKIKGKRIDRGGIGGLQYDIWKEQVRMDAVRLSKHINHWNINNLKIF